MKKMLFITNIPAPYKVSYFELLNQFFELTVIYERKIASNRDSRWKNEDKRYFKEIYLNGKNIGVEASLSIEIIKYLKKKYDVILLNGYSSPTLILAIAYMRLKKMKFGIICDGILPTIDSKIKKKLKSFLISSAFFWMSSNDITSNQLLSYGAVKTRIYKYPFSSIYMDEIVNINEITSEAKLEYKHEIKCQEKKMILYVGQIIYRKGIDILLEAFQNIHGDIRLYIIGGTKEQASKYKYYDNKHITYIDFQSKTSLKKYYMAADVFVLPTREDIWGLVVNEALAYGVPVITTKYCGAGLELIKNAENGYLIEEISAKILAEKITETVEDTKIQHLNSQSILTAKKYTLERMAITTKEIIDDFDEYEL